MLDNRTPIVQLMNQHHSKSWIYICCLFSITVVAACMPMLLGGHLIPGLGSDSGKNIYTYLYQCEYGQGVWSDAMNYPYGEHIVYTDGQPILSVLLSHIGSHLTPDQALTTMWRLIFISYVLSVIYSYKTLCRFGVTPVLALVFAALVTFMSPQVMRLSGHFALSYVCVLPMLFYFTLVYHESGKLKYLCFITILFLVSISFQPYFGGVLIVWTGLYTIGYLLFQKANLKQKIGHLIPMLAATGFVLGIFGIFLKITDPITDRPQVPFGMLAYCTHLKDIFTSVHSPIWGFASNHSIVKGLREGGEGYTYIGLATIMTLVFAVVVKARKVISNSGFSYPGIAPIWPFMAVVALLFSMGIPFIWHLEWLLDKLSVFRQFRAIGRFSWIFYYIISICSAVLLFQFLQGWTEKGKVVFARSVVVVAISIWSIEAMGYVAQISETCKVGAKNYDVFFAKHEQDWKGFLAEKHLTNDSFQAVLLLPFFEVGSEKLWVGGDDNTTAWAVSMAARAGLQLHLPIMDCMMSRTSWSQAFKEVKISAGPDVDMPVMDEMKDPRPLLLLSLDMHTPDPGEQYIIDNAVKIGHYLQNSVYMLYPEQLRVARKKRKEVLWSTIENMKAGDSCLQNGRQYFVEHFDTGKALLKLRGKGSARYSGTDTAIICSVPLQSSLVDDRYEFSCWFRVSDKDFKSPDVMLEFTGSDGKLSSTIVAMTRESTDNEGLWLRNSCYFTKPAACTSIRLKVIDLYGSSYLAMDELLIRPLSTTIICKDLEGRVMVNNHPFKH